MPTVRIRYLPDNMVAGTKTIYGTPFTVTRQGRTYMNDVSGNLKEDNAFAMDYLRHGGVFIGGEKLDGDSPSVTWSHVPAQLNPGRAPSLPARDGNIRNNALRAFNISNPSRHNQSLLTAIIELRDLPHMLRFAGRLLNAPSVTKKMITSAYGGGGPRLSKRSMSTLRSHNLLPHQNGRIGLPKTLAAANLAWQFGWAPLISDINKLMNFQQALDRKRAEVNKAFSGSGLRRRITLFNDTVTGFETDYILDSVGAAIVAVDVTYTRFARSWCTLVYKPLSPSVLPPSDLSLQANLLGLDAHGILQSAWELLPWSWLVGWCSNVTDILSSASNQMQLGVRMNTMQHFGQRATTGGSSNVFGAHGEAGAASVSGGFCESGTKERFVGRPDALSFSVGVPILSANQLSILGSITMLHGGK